MKQQLIFSALDVILQRETKAKQIASDNRKKAMKDETFSKIFSDYQNAVILYAKGEIDKTKIIGIKTALDKRLQELGIGSIEPEHSCKKCQDSGYKEDGTYCDCLKKEVSKILFKQSGFAKLHSFKESNFEIFSNKDEIKKIYDLMQKWCQKDSEKKLVYLLGNTGTGKTYLTSCMANEFISQGKIVYMTTAFNLSQDFLKFHKSYDDKEKSSVFENYLETEVLFIDDLGTEPVFNNVTREYLYLLINERKNKGLRTIITSNLEPIDIREKYDERIFSRIMDKENSIVLKLDSNDVRLKK